MTSTTKASIRFALLAYSVYCWVDGSARTRTTLGSTTFEADVPTESELSIQEDGYTPGGWRKVWDWLHRRGLAMSEEEQGAIGKVDVVSAFLLFNGIQRISLLPMQMQPSIPMGFPHLKAGGRLSWRVLILMSAVLTLVHETQRAGILYHLRRRRVNLTEQIRKDLANMRIGEVIVRGDDLTLPRDTDEQDEEECLICSGSAETMSTSSHTIDADGGERISSSTGPLEAFCTIAPQKHLTHRTCFLRWHAAYLQQSRNSYGNPVALIDDPQSQSAPRSLEQLFIRASIILQAAGFNYLTPKLKRTTDIRPADGENTSPTLTIHHSDIAVPQQSHSLLATLRTSAPPCPGCRSPVALRFIDARPPPTPVVLDSPDVSNQPRQPLSFLRIILWLRKLIASKFWREWPKIVTGRTLSGYFSSLLSFVAVLVAITRARENSTLNKSLGISFATSRISI
ncbi:hypothetical protein RhiJN_27584 [Ceratobasidium sp. AG-Ba]|nr:hypothetical protein RhiJN_13528 [Ceratobasidium sp. AG-Ba]QRV99565.1 hypothetical protein RhiJN_27584 [Ceratobasidium sp. AG-Ba]QRW14087.1 hypothetical protein RhiLY_13086 [Ceratobasidium sp. AG-Ba]